MARGMMAGCASSDMKAGCAAANGMAREVHGMLTSGTLTGMTTGYGAEEGGGNPGMTAGLAGGGLQAGNGSSIRSRSIHTRIRMPMHLRKQLWCSCLLNPLHPNLCSSFGISVMPPMDIMYRQNIAFVQFTLQNPA